MTKIIGNSQGEKGFYKPPIYTGLREVKVVSVIRTLNCVGSGSEGDEVRSEWQYWTDEGEQITSKPTELDHFVWLEKWMDVYEERVGDGKAKDVYVWLRNQGLEGVKGNGL